MEAPMATPARTNQRNEAFAEKLKDQKWLTLVGMPILLVTTFNGIYSVWGLLFVFWGIVSIRAGEVFLLETVERNKDPVLYWIISILWIGFGLLYILTDFFPEYLT